MRARKAPYRTRHVREGPYEKYMFFRKYIRSKKHMFFEKAYIFLKSIYFLRKAPSRTPYPLKASLFIKFTESKMFIVFVCVQFFKNVGCHYYNQRGVLKIEILILLRLARFQNLGTPPIRPSAYKGQPKSATYRSAIRFRSFCQPQLYVFL